MADGRYVTAREFVGSASDSLISSFASVLAMERATYTTKSFIIALALVKRRLTADQAAETAHVEVNSQIERWGEVEDCKFSLLFICWHSFRFIFVISDLNFCCCKTLTC